MEDQENQGNNQDLSEQKDRKGPEKGHESKTGLSSDTDQNLSEKHEPGQVNESDIDSSSNSEKPKGNDHLQSEIPSQQKIDIQKERKKLMENIKSKTPKDIIYDCLSESFEGAGDIYNFCFYCFEDLYKELIETDGFEKNIRRLIQYCKTHRQDEYLWSCIKEKRINQYNIYYLKWKQAIEDQQRRKGSENLLTIDSIDQYKSRAITREKPLSPDGEGQTHPLSGNDPAAINEWFFNELELHEKSQVLSVALFEGINRKFIEPISQEIERILFEKI